MNEQPEDLKRQLALHRHQAQFCSRCYSLWLVGWLPL